MKNLVEFQPPGGDRLFIVLRVVTSRDRIPRTPLDNIPLDLARSPGWKPSEKMIRRAHRWFNSQCQFLNRFEDGLTELIRSPYAHPPVKSFEDVGAD